MMKRKKMLIFLIILLLFVNISVEAKGINLNLLDSTVSCSGYFGDPNNPKSLMGIMKQIFFMIQIAVPILLLVFTTIDFSKVVFSNSKDGMEKAKKNFIKRAIISVFVFFIPTFLTIIFRYVDNKAIQACQNYFK